MITVIMIMKKMMVVEKIIHANWDSAKFHGAADASALPSHLQSENFPLLYRVFFFTVSHHTLNCFCDKLAKIGTQLILMAVVVVLPPTTTTSTTIDNPLFEEFFDTSLKI